MVGENEIFRKEQYSIVVALSTRPQSRGVGLPLLKEHSYNMLWIQRTNVESPRDVPYGYKNLQECMYSLPTILP
jgi:hypothetical protein